MGADGADEIPNGPRLIGFRSSHGSAAWSVREEERRGSATLRVSSRQHDPFASPLVDLRIGPDRSRSPNGDGFDPTAGGSPGFRRSFLKRGVLHARGLVCQPLLSPECGYCSRWRRSRDFLRFDATIHLMSGSSTVRSRSKSDIPALKSAATATLQQ